MADNSPPLITPFRGERYAAAARLSNRIAPPYDVITPEERAALAARSEHNIVHLTLPDGEGDARYEHAAATLAEWRRSHALVRDEEPGVYVVQQEFRTPDGRMHLRTGVIGALHVEPWDERRVRPHERTKPGPKEDRLRLARATKAIFESLFVLARDEDGQLVRLLHAACRKDPVAVGELADTAVGLWYVSGDEAAAIADAAGAGPVYMADGHHRYETAVTYREENPAADRIPALVVPIRDPGLVVLPTHRLIHGRAPDPAILDQLAPGAEETHEVSRPDLTLPLFRELCDEGPACAAALSGGHRRVWLLGKNDRPPIADIEEAVVTPLREAAGADASVSYTPSGEEALAAVDGGNAAAAVLVAATPVQQILDASDAGGIMPPKSTYFLPKVPAGLVIMDYREDG